MTLRHTLTFIHLVEAAEPSMSRVIIYIGSCLTW